MSLKPGLHIVGKLASACLRPCPKETAIYITALQVLIANISCERLLLSKHALPCEKNYPLIAPISLKVTGDSLLIHEFAYSLFISLCSVNSNVTVPVRIIR